MDHEGKGGPALDMQSEEDIFSPVFELMIENESTMFKQVLNAESYLLTQSNLKNLIKLMQGALNPH